MRLGDVDLLEELVVRPLAERVLVDDRDRLPDLGIVEPVGVDVVELALIPDRLLGALEGEPLAFRLDRGDLVARFR